MGIELAIENGVYAIQVDSLYEPLIEETATRLGKKGERQLRLVGHRIGDPTPGLQTAMLTSNWNDAGRGFGAFARYKDSEHLNLSGIHRTSARKTPSPEVYTGV
ncbi:MAG: hypothetical protein IPM21_10570 [Acidobacteria bacterium]|nr:hypothetical protein [Acidobacteriota bacterium]